VSHEVYLTCLHRSTEPHTCPHHTSTCSFTFVNKKITVCRDLYTTCARIAYSEILSQVSLRHPEDGQYGPKNLVVHLATKYTYVTQLCSTIHSFQDTEDLVSWSRYFFIRVYLPPPLLAKVTNFSRLIC